MKESELLNIISFELNEADQQIDIETPLDYYLGNPRGDECEGHSSVQSTDVADAIEWIMPQIMKSFTQNNEVVIFDPVRPGDENQAELESQYVYDVIMKENDGFIILHNFVKDALMQNNGYIKIWYEDEDETETYEFTSISAEQLQLVLSDPKTEVLSKDESISVDPQTGQPVIFYDIRIAVTRTNGKICMDSVGPEDFRCNPDHNSINFDNARFTCHLMKKRMGDLRKEGIPKEKLQEIGKGTSNTNITKNTYRFTAQDETVYTDYDTTDDDSIEDVYLAECYMYADVNDDGIAEYVKVTAAGQTTPTTILEIEPIDYCPWISTTAILMSHKWRGLSIYDRLKEIQDQKTSLLRNTFDNLYLQNNQRHTVITNQVEMGDLMVSRPGGIVRVKSQDAVKPLATPAVFQEAFSMLEYLDLVRAGRSGVSPEGEVTPQRIGERVGSEGVERMLTAKEELVGLMVRVIAETGLKPLCSKIRDLCTQHVDAIQDFQFRGQWVKVNPSTWEDRSKCTVRVGTGTGDHRQQIASLNQILTFQAQAKQEPGQIIVNEAKVYKALDDLCKYTGLNSANSYFVDPSTPEGQQKRMQTDQQIQQQQQQQQQLQMEQLKAQAQMANAESEKAAAQMLNVKLRGQVDQTKLALQNQKQQSDNIISGLKQQLDELKAVSDAKSKSENADIQKANVALSTALKITELEQAAKQQQDEQFKSNMDTVSESARRSAA